MKFTTKLFMLPIALLLVTTSCTAQKGKKTSDKNDSSAPFYTKSDSPEKSYTTRYVKDFDELVIHASLNIEVEESGNKNAYIKWSGDDVVFQQKGKQLIIMSKRGSNKSEKIYIGASKLSKVFLNGSGNLKITNHKSKNMEVVLNGSGEIIINNVKNQSVKATVNGSGDLALTGELKEGKLTVNGSGEINASKVKLEKVDCYVNGSGTIKIYAAKYVDGKVWGSGQIEHPNLKIERKDLIITSGTFKAKIN